MSFFMELQLLSFIFLFQGFFCLSRLPWQPVTLAWHGCQFSQWIQKGVSQNKNTVKQVALHSPPSLIGVDLHPLIKGVWISISFSNERSLEEKQTNGKGDSDKLNRGLKNMLQRSRQLPMQSDSEAKQIVSWHFANKPWWAECGSQRVRFIDTDVWNSRRHW